MKTGSRNISFYSLIMALNCAVAIMFWVVLTPVPSTAAPQAIPGVKVAPVREVPLVSGTPERVVIPSIAVDLAVDVGSYNPTTQGWTVGTDKAYYADVSVPANDSNGVTLIYGHAQAQIFARLAGLSEGARIAVYTDNERVFHYRYQSVKNVLPTDTSVFETSGPPTLVLQTCTGAWDAYRALYSFEFIDEERV